MKTRKQYLNREVTHREYYGQFVTDTIKDTVRKRIGLDRIRASKEESFNDIPLQEWDKLHYVVMIEAGSLLKEAGDVNADSLGNSVCVAKEAARQLLEERI